MPLSNTAETPIATIKLVADKNLAMNGSVQFNHYIYSVVNNNHLSASQFMTSTRIDVNGQSAEAFIFNSTSPTECSNGTHMFHFVVVKIYTNITGEIYFYLRAQMSNQGFHYGDFDVTARISNGT